MITALLNDYKLSKNEKNILLPILKIGFKFSILAQIIIYDNNQPLENTTKINK